MEQKKEREREREREREKEREERMIYEQTGVRRCSGIEGGK